MPRVLIGTSADRHAVISLADLNPRNLGQRLLGEETTQDLREAAKLLPTASELVGASSAAVAAPAATASPQPAATGPRLVAFDPEAT